MPKTIWRIAALMLGFAIASIGVASSSPVYAASGMDEAATAAMPAVRGVTWRIVLDFRGADLTASGFGVTTPFNGKLDQATVTAIRSTIAGIFARWGVRVDVVDAGDVLGPSDVVVHFAGSDTVKVCGCGGVAWVNGATFETPWRQAVVYREGIPGDPISIAVTAAHEAGHMFGLNHPVQPDESIMGTGNIVSGLLAPWRPDNVEQLDTFFLTHSAV